MLAAGAALLWGGGEALVSGAVALARRFGLPAVLIGVVLMGFGTSTPELVTSVNATLTGATAIAIGNVVGSNTANILLILGVAALIAPIRLERGAFGRDTWTMATAALFLALAGVWGPMDAMDGALFLILLGVYLLVAFLSEAENAVAGTGGGTVVLAGGPPASPISPEGLPPRPLWQGIGLALVGLAGVLAGAQLFVSGAVNLSRGLGISEAVIGVTVVAVGTSLPELFASVVAARRGHPELAVGNILGSNVFNVFGVLGASAMVDNLEFEPEAVTRDLPVMLGATVLLVALIMLRERIGRVTGAAMLAGYAGYLALM